MKISLFQFIIILIFSYNISEWFVAVRTKLRWKSLNHPSPLTSLVLKLRRISKSKNAFFFFNYLCTKGYYYTGKVRSCCEYCELFFSLSPLSVLVQFATVTFYLICLWNIKAYFLSYRQLFSATDRDRAILINVRSVFFYCGVKVEKVILLFSNWKICAKSCSEEDFRLVENRLDVMIVNM